MPDTTVTLKVGGLELSDWDGLTINRAMDDMVDSFAFDTQTSPEIRARIKPVGYEPVEVYIGDENIITGKLDKPSASMASAALTIEGRSPAGQLVDCNIKGAVQFGNQTLGTIGRKIAAPFGVRVVTPLGDSARLGDQVVTSDGDTAAGFLQRIGLDMGWLWRSFPDGALALHRPDAKGPPVARLVEGQGVFMDCRLSVDASALYSDYTVKAAVGSWESVTDNATDSKVRLYRPKIITGTDGSFREVGAKAKMERALAVSAAVSVEVDVGDWYTDDGVLFEPGQFLEVTSETSLWLTRPILFQIAATSMSLSGSGRLATLRLILPGTYSGEAVLPW